MKGRRTRLIRLFALVLALMMALSLAACGGGSGSKGGEKKLAHDGTLMIGQTRPLSTFQHGTFGGRPTLLSLPFDVLFQRNGDTGEDYSYILEEWYYVDDTTIHLKLKPGIEFSGKNGKTYPMTGEDILYSIGSYAEKGSPFVIMFAPYDLENSTVSDDGLTVTLKTFQPWGPGLGAMTLPIVCKEWCQEVGWDSEDWWNDPVGSGPYYVDEFVTGSHVTFKLKDNYWGDFTSPYKTIVVNYYAEPSTMFMALEAGDIDLAVGVGAQDYQRALAGVDGIKAEATHGGASEGLSWNMCLNPYTKDENVRKALTMAVDWDKLIEVQSGPLGKRMNSLCPSTCSYHVDEPLYKYDPDTARKMLADAGIKDGDLNFKMYSTQANEKLLTSLKYYLDQVGVGLEVEFMDFATQMQRFAPAEDPWLISFVSGTTYTCEVHTSMQSLMMNETTYHSNYIDDPYFNELADKTKITIGEERAALMKDLQDYTYEHCLFVPIEEVVYGICYRTEVIKDVNFMHDTDSLDLRTIVFA